MPRALPQAPVHDLGGAHLLIAVTPETVADVVLNLLVEHPALGVPEHHAGGLGLHMEEVELAAELTVVAALRLFHPMEVVVQGLLVAPGGAVDPLQHGVARVAPPIGPGHLGELEGAEAPGARDMRPAAEVYEIPLPVSDDSSPSGIEAMISAL